MRVISVLRGAGVLRVVLGVAAAALFAGVLLTFDASAFQAYLARLSMLTVLLGFLTYGAQNLFRALRYRALLGRPDLPLEDMLAISLYHNGMVRLLPFKLGELTYVVLMQRRHGIPVQAGIVSLAWSRLLELVMILLVGGLSFITAAEAALSQRVVIAAACVLGIAAMGALLFSPAALERLLNQGERLALVRRATPALRRLLHEVDALRQPRRLMAGAGWSLGTYGSTFFTSVILLNAVEVALPLHAFVVVISMGMFAAAFPLNISGFGLVEWSLAVGLMHYAGLPLEAAAAMGLLVNGFQQMSALVWGLIGFVLVQRLPAAPVVVS